MLQNLPSGVGRAVAAIRPGPGALTVNGPVAGPAPATIEVTSAAFADGEAIPARYTADGEGISPPLAWRNLPVGTRALVLLLEDADVPGPRPLVHALLTDLPVVDGMLDVGALPVRQGRLRPGMGRNSYFRRTYLPMDPVPGHGAHRYCFQLFALDRVPEFHQPPGRSALLRAMAGHVLAKGLLVGTYQRP